jgi:hypothetical protein
MNTMHSRQRVVTRAGAAAIGLLISASSSIAQPAIRIGTREVSVHGSFQQGFALTSENNFLTMNTTKGSGEMTDAAVNLSSNLAPRLRVGAQFYSRNIGQLGNGALQVDWAFADYRFNDRVGVRAGKIKTVLGLFTDTQDMEFLYTWALLPQGTYPLDLRSVTIAHVGGDVYGVARVGKAGSLAYTGFYGAVQDDNQGGYRYGIQDTGLNFNAAIATHGGGFDTRWTTPVNGLMAGYSYMQTKAKLDLSYPLYQVNLSVSSDPVRRQAVYSDYQGSRLRLSGEIRRETSVSTISPEGLFPTSEVRSAMAFGAASYRLSRQLEAGSYYSRFVYDTALPSASPDNHIYDAAVTARFDLNRFWNVKIEEHFIDGTGSQLVARGFYLRDNTSGFSPNMRLLVIRTGVNF